MNWYKNISKIAEENNLRIMGTKVNLIKSETIEGVNYNLYKAIENDFGFIRILDVDSGEVLTIKKYPNYEQSEKEYNDIIIKTKKFTEENIPAFTDNSDLPESTQQLIRNKLRNGMILWKGHSARPADPGDFGAGKYFTTMRVRAEQYGEVHKYKVTLNNPLIVSVEKAYDLSTQYGTISGIRGKDGSGPTEEALKRSQEMAGSLNSSGYDGLVSVSPSKGELEVVVYNPSSYQLIE